MEKHGNADNDEISKKRKEEINEKNQSRAIRLRKNE